MSDPRDTPKTDAPAAPRAVGSSDTKPYSKSYEENPLDKQALLKAAEAVPVKDYSDYEIAIETKSHYDDALFGDEQDLDQALQQAREEQKTTELTRAREETASSPPPAPVSPVEELKFDFSAFLQSAPAETTTSAGYGINDSRLSATPDTATELTPNQPLMEDIAETPAPIPTAEPEAATRSLADKIKLKAQQQLKKSKAQFDEYIGRSLPERELPLDFTFPVQKSKKEFDNLVSGYSIRKLFETKGKSELSIFKQADHDLTTLNKCQMLASSRHSLLEAYSRPLIEKIREIINDFERKPVLTGDGKRLELAEHCQNVFKQLVNGYKQLYSHYYEAANVIYGPQRHTANNVACELLELLLIEARLCFALHTRLPASSIKAMNKLFTAVRLYEPQLLTQARTSLFSGGKTSAKALYFEFQTLLSLDGCNITSLLNRVLHPYLGNKLALMSLLETAEPTIDNGLYWVIPHDHQGAATVSKTPPPTATAFPPNVIDISRFVTAIKRDYFECLTQVAQQPSQEQSQQQSQQPWKPSDKYLAAIKPHYALSLLAGLHENIQHLEQSTTAPVYSLYQPVKMRSYSGLDRVIAHLNFSYALATRKPARKDEPVRDLPEKPKLDKAQWQLAKEEGDSLYLQLSEAEADTAVDIGQLLLLIENVETEGEKSADGIQPDEERLILGVVRRLERLQGNKLHLVLARLSQQLTHALLGPDPANAKPVLFAIAPSGPRLILDHTLELKPGQHTITFPDGSQRQVEADQPLWMTHRFRVVSLR